MARRGQGALWLSSWLQLGIRHFLWAGGGLGLLILALGVIWGLTRWSASGGQPQFSARNFDRTRAWVKQRFDWLEQVRRQENASAYKVACKELEGEFQSLKGTEITWQIPVKKVDDQRVVLETRWHNLELAFLHQDEKLQWDNCFLLRIGQQIAHERVISLKTGDKVQISGKLTEVTFQAGSHAYIQLNHVRAL